MTHKLFIIIFYFIQCTFAQTQHTHSGSMTEMDEPVPAFNATGDEPMSYALFPDNKTYFYIHVAMMTIAFWVLMPIGVMLGIAKSSLHIPTQILAYGFALVGFFFAKLYGHTTPQLYRGNSHHTLGWVLFAFLNIQLSVGVVRKCANTIARNTAANQYEHRSLLNRGSSSGGSTSSGSDRHSEETLHMNDMHHLDKHINPHDNNNNEEEEEEEDLDQDDFLNTTSTKHSSLIQHVLPYIPNVVKKGFVLMAYNQFTKVFCRWFHMIMGRTFIVLIFVQTVSGLVVYHGVCRSWAVLGCIAHLIKGGIFFFYGCVTFGRYLGAFANRGWAWNKVVIDGSSFSFEMIESCLIFIYGITNTWMEHFGQNKAWTHKDLEHASLAFMWWWCGLIGILVESRAIRRLLQRTIVLNQKDLSGYSLNPFPALTVLMTGISMGNHHQDTVYSTGVHYMWGLLLASAAICRFITYVTLYRNQPQDSEPTRPPSEVVGAFLLLAGSILFMASNSGTILWLRRENVDSMFLMNVCIALTSIVLCYVAGLMIIKAWAEKREALKKQQHL